MIQLARIHKKFNLRSKYTWFVLIIFFALTNTYHLTGKCYVTFGTYCP